MNHEQLEKLISQLSSAMSQAAIEGAWQTQAKLATIKREMERSRDDSELK